jgi:hypothetical protein
LEVLSRLLGQRWEEAFKMGASEESAPESDLGEDDDEGALLGSSLHDAE